MMFDPHPDSAELAYASAAQLLERLERGDTTSESIVETLVARVHAVDAEGVALGSVAALADDALAVARERDEQRARGEILGPLHGLPVLIKDNIEARGLPALAGSTALQGRPTSDAALVRTLRDAGAVIVGSTNLSQWANIRSPHSTSGYSASGGLVANPWALDRSAGGSSSGSGAALAAGLAPLAVGTETDGSITCPASLNGVVGLKPTVGVTSREGVIPISRSQDSPGPMARHVADLALFYGAMVGESAPPSRELRWIEASSWRTSHGGTDRLFDEVMQHLRASGLEITRADAALPSALEYEDELTVLLCELGDGMDAYLAQRPGEGPASLAEVIAYEDEYSELEQRYFGHEFLVRAVASGGCATEAYALARERNIGWAREVALGPLLAEHDVVISPAYGPAWKSDLVNGDNAKYVSASIMAAAVASWPILTVPMGLVEGLPVGLTLVGRPHSEWALLDAARQVEEILRRHSPVSTPTWRNADRG